MIGARIRHQNEARIIKLSPITEKVERLNHILISTKEADYVLRIREIVCVEADSNYTVIRLSDDKRIHVSKPLKYFEKKLSIFDNFFRVHQSYLVNFAFVKFWNHKEGIHVESVDVIIPVSRRKRAEVQSWLRRFSL